MQIKTSEIIIDDMVFYAYHGYYQEEQRIGCKYTVSLRITTPLDIAGKSDCLSQTINYEDVFVEIQKIMDVPSKLIENVAQRIIDNLFSKFPSIEHLDLTLYKYNPPLGGQVGRVGIHLYV